MKGVYFDRCSYIEASGLETEAQASRASEQVNSDGSRQGHSPNSALLRTINYNNRITRQMSIGFFFAYKMRYLRAM